MNKSPEQDLHSLLPTFAGPLPPELVDLATSLLAQSRNRISNLKPREEPARSYVCAHIACDRLKYTLDLPALDPRPPLPKRAYESLLAHFRKSLPAPAAAKKGAYNASVAPSASRLSKSLRGEIAQVCAELAVPKAETHICDGTAAVLEAAQHNTQGNAASAVIAAVTYITIEALTPEHGTHVGSIYWKSNTDLDEKLEEIICAIAKPGLKGPLVKKWVNELSSQGQEKWPWIKAIPPAGGVKETQTAAKRKRAAESGIGSMLQERVDYLSEKRRTMYARWREQIMRQIEEMKEQ